MTFTNTAQLHKQDSLSYISSLSHRSTDILNETKKYVSGAANVISKIQPDLSMSVEMIYTPEQWHCFSHKERRSIGMAMARLVRQQLVPFKFDTDANQWEPNRYVVITSPSLSSPLSTKHNLHTRRQTS